eukprot:4919497-Prymnesium_polylepis.1
MPLPPPPGPSPPSLLGGMAWNGNAVGRSVCGALFVGGADLVPFLNLMYCTDHWRTWRTVGSFPPGPFALRT